MSTQSSRSKINPGLLAGYDEERDVVNRTGKGRVDRVLLNRGDNWIVRFLHPRMGKNKDRWFARVAQHWLNKKPIVCPTHTAAWLGGNKDAYCPVCEASDNLRADRNERINKRGFELAVQLKWITYCLVLEKVTRSSEEVIELPEVLTVYEFSHYKNSFDELFGFVRSYRGAEWGIFDVEAGCDFGVTRSAKGIRLDRMQPSPLLGDFDLTDELFDKYLKRIESQLKEPVIKIPSEEALHEFAEKAYDDVESVASGGGGGSRRRRSSRDEDDADDHDDPRGRSRRYSRDGDDDRGSERPSRRGLDHDDGDADRDPEQDADAGGSRLRRGRVRDDADDRDSRSDDRDEPRGRERRRPSEEDDGQRRRRPSEEDDGGQRRRRAPADAADDGDGDGGEPAEAARSGNRRRESAPPQEPDDVPMDYGKDSKAAEKPEARSEAKPEASAETRPPADREAERDDDNLPDTSREGRRASTMQRRAFPETRGRSGRGDGTASLDEEEHLPEESKDHAPPEREQDGNQDGPSGDERGRSSVSSRISSRVSRASRRGE